MSAQMFYKSIKPMTTFSGVALAVFSAQAHGSSQASIQALAPRNQEKHVRLLPNSTVFMAAPPVITGTRPLPQLSDVLGKAFNHQDLNSLYGAGSFGSCETTSPVPSHFEKNYSNFAYSCLESFKNRNAISFDERFQADPQNQGVATAPLGGRLQWTDISASARGRLLQRSIQDLAQRNKTLANIIQGRISFDFGLGGFFSSPESKPSISDPKPRFVVDVQQPDAGQRTNKRKYVASIGSLGQGSLGTDKSAAWFNHKPHRAKRTLRETFEPLPLSGQGQEVPSLTAIPSANDFQTDLLSSMKLLSKRAGLEQLPFTKMNMRAERRVVDGKNQFALRATESQELFFAEFPDARKMSPSTFVWGYKIPWQRHALNVRYDNAIEERTTTYSYKIDDSNKTDLSFNHKNNGMSAGFVISF